MSRWHKLVDLQGKLRSSEPKLRIEGTRDLPDPAQPPLDECRRMPGNQCYYAKCPRKRGACPLDHKKEWKDYLK